MEQYKIEDFRIAYDALYGYCIEKSETVWVFKENSNLVRQVLGYGEKCTTSSEYKFFAHAKMPKNNEGIIGTFLTKHEAIQFIKDLCSETEYYYPPEFENAND